MIKISIIGTGSWGTALAQVLVDNNIRILMFGKNYKEINDINKNHKNSIHFNNLKISKKIKATKNFKNIIKFNSKYIILATPSYSIKNISKLINKKIKKPIIIINAAKGFYSKKNIFLTKIIKNNINPKNLIAILSILGPSHAEEVILRKLTLINLVTEKKNNKIAIKLQKFFSNKYFRVYINNDIFGSQICAGIKNVIAIASGIIYGLGYRENTQAALIARGLSEIIEYSKIFNKKIKKKTFLGLCGIGDLIATCMSKNSRNFQIGKIIGKKNEFAKKYYKNINNKTIEGIYATKIIHNISKEKKIKMPPIINEIYNILYKKKKPIKAINDLMRRKLKIE